jgi:transcription initiation factor TFIIF subunit alpha
MTIQSLITIFKDRVDKTNTSLFIKLVKAVSSFDKQRSWLIPLPVMPTDDHVNMVMRGGQKSAPSKAASPS